MKRERACWTHRHLAAGCSATNPHATTLGNTNAHMNAKRLCLKAATTRTALGLKNAMPSRPSKQGLVGKLRNQSRLSTARSLGAVLPVNVEVGEPLVQRDLPIVVLFQNHSQLRPQRRFKDCFLTLRIAGEGSLQSLQGPLPCGHKAGSVHEVLAQAGQRREASRATPANLPVSHVAQDTTHNTRGGRNCPWSSCLARRLAKAQSGGSLAGRRCTRTRRPGSTDPRR